MYAHTIVLIEEGPNGIGHAYGFYVENLDSIYVASNTKRLFIIDRTGVVYRKFKYSDNNSDNNYFIGNSHLSTMFYSNLGIRGSVLYFPVRVQNWTNVNSSNLDKNVIELQIDLNDNSIKPLPLRYPTDYFDDGAKLLEYSRTYNNGVYVHSYACDHNLYVSTSVENETITEKVNAKSKYFENTFNPASSKIPRNSNG